MISLIYGGTSVERESCSFFYPLLFSPFKAGREKLCSYLYLVSTLCVVSNETALTPTPLPPAGEGLNHEVGKENSYVGHVRNVH